MNKSKQQMVAWLLFLVATLVSLLTACSFLPQVSAEERLFLNLSLDYLAAYQLPKTNFKETPVGGLSALTYDRTSDRFLALSDDQSNLAPARFYTLKLNLSNKGIQNVTVETVTFLKTKDGNPYPQGSIDPEGIAVSPQKTLFISSEGNNRNGIPPTVGEYDLKTGRLKQSFPIPSRYIPDRTGENQQRGILLNLGFEALTINPTGSVSTRDEPIRLFTATESALIQDRDAPALDDQGNPKPQITKCRLLHYLVSDRAPILIAEHVYPLAPAPSGALYHGLSELLAVDQGGHFLSLERSLGFFGFTIRIYQVATGTATDTSQIASLKGSLKGVQPVQKKLLLDLNQLGMPLDNLEGMTLGPILPDGSQSLVLVSDNNFKDRQVTQFLLFRLRQGLT